MHISASRPFTRLTKWKQNRPTIAENETENILQICIFIYSVIGRVSALAVCCVPYIHFEVNDVKNSWNWQFQIWTWWRHCISSPVQNMHLQCIIIIIKWSWGRPNMMFSLLHAFITFFHIQWIHCRRIFKYAEICFLLHRFCFKFLHFIFIVCDFWLVSTFFTSFTHFTLSYKFKLLLVTGEQLVSTSAL